MSSGRQPDSIVAHLTREVVLTRLPFEAWVPWGFCFDEHMALQQCVHTSNAANSEQLRGCVGMVLDAINGERATCLDDLLALVDDDVDGCLTITLCFRQSDCEQFN